MNDSHPSAPGSGALARIGLQARAQTRYFIFAVASELKRRTCAEITLYCNNEQDVAFYRDLDKERICNDYVDLDVCFAERLRQLPRRAAMMEEARHWEERMGATINLLAVSNRHLGRGYALGGFHHPRSRLSKSGYDDLIAHFCALLGFWDDEVRNRKLTVIINGSKESAVIARIHDIPYRVMNGSRYRNYHNWAWNEYYENPQFSEGFTRGEGADLSDLPSDRPYDSHLSNRRRFFATLGLRRMLQRSALEIIRRAWWILRGYKKARGYYLGEILKFHYRSWRNWRRLLRLARTTLADLDGRMFVYYPLHVEPETALQGLSPEYFYQLSAIAAISRDLPAGAVLGVKEAFGAVGRRPADFHRQIAEFKNVVLIDPAEPGIDCVRRAAATVTICGTAGLEAALMGKPVITFGRHNIYNVLPHVHVVGDESKLPQILHDAIFTPADTGRRIGDAQRFLKAVVSNSFDMRDYDYFHVEHFQTQAVSDACDHLIRSLAQTQRHAKESLFA